MLKEHYQAVLNKMAPGGIREKYDFGRNTRTQFELSEAGENNLLCDEIQFQLDRYHSATSNELAKISALQALIDIFADKVTKTIKSATRGYIQELFKLLSGGTASNNANSRFFFALILIICSDTDGSFDHTFNLPFDLVNKVLVTQRVVDTPCICAQSTSADAHYSTGLQRAAVEAEETGYRRKRKYASALSTIAETATGGSPLTNSIYTAGRKTDLPSPTSSTTSASNSIKSNGSKPALLRGYGSSKASICGAAKLSSPISLLSSTASPVAGVAAGSECSDNYWFEDELSVKVEAPASVPVSVPIVQQCAGAGGFHKKRKLANPLKHLPAEHEAPTSIPCENATAPRTVEIPTQPLYDKLSSIYDTFLCMACCTGGGGDGGGDDAHSQQDELLQLVLVHSYLSAKVQSLASVKLDIFQTAAQGEPGSEQEAQTNNDTHGAHHQENSIVPRAAGSHSNDDGSAADHEQDDGFQGIRSPLDPTCAASSSFYKRQAESLSQFQLAMLSNGDNLQKNFDSPYLHFVCCQLAARFRDLQVIPCSMDAAAECARRVTLGKLWLTLGVIDSSCFRCPANQRTITEFEPEQHGGAVPPILVQLLDHITAPLMEEVELLLAHDLAAGAGSDSDPCASQSQPAGQHSPVPVVAQARSSQPCTPASDSKRNVGMPPSSASRHKDAGSELPVEWRRFQNLFHEVPIVRTRHVIDQPSQHEGGTHEGASTESIHAVIGSPELCTATLKALISISNDNPSAAQALLEESDVLSWTVAMLAWCTAWRCRLEESHRAVGKTNKSTASHYSNFSKALSPDETRLERFIPDMMLHLQSLLRNLTEHSAAAVASVCVWDSLHSHEHILRSLPRRLHHAGKRASADAQFMKSCPLVATFLQTCESTEDRAASCSSATLSDLLVEILLLETKEQLRDLEDTDAAINSSSAPPTGMQHVDPIASPTTASAAPLPTTAGSASAARKSTDAKKTASAAKGAVELLPIAELTISAYAALLLQTLVSEDQVAAVSADRTIQLDCDDRNDCLIRSPGRVVCNLASATAGPLSVAVASRLPRGNWWLCSRVLKAFLSLQGQTGIMILDNIAAVSRAVQWMARQDEQPESTAAIAPDQLAAGSLYDSPSGNHVAVSTTALVRSYPTKQVPPADLQERIDFTAEDDFFSDFAPAESAVQGAQKSNSNASKSGAGKWVWDGSDYVWKCADDSPPQLTVLKKTVSEPIRTVLSGVGTAAVSLLAARTEVDWTREEETAEVTRAVQFKKATTFPVRQPARPVAVESGNPRTHTFPPAPACVPAVQNIQRKHCGPASAVTSGHVKQTAFPSSSGSVGGNADAAPALPTAPKIRASGAAPDATVRPTKQVLVLAPPPLPLPPAQESEESRPTESSGWRGKRKLSGVQGISANTVKK